MTSWFFVYQQQHETQLERQFSHLKRYATECHPKKHLNIIPGLRSRSFRFGIEEEVHMAEKSFKSGFHFTFH